MGLGIAGERPFQGGETGLGKKDISRRLILFITEGSQLLGQGIGIERPSTRSAMRKSLVFEKSKETKGG